MTLVARFPLMAFALVLLSIVGVCIAQRSVELLLIAGALAAMSWYVTEGPRGRVLPRWVSSLLVMAVSLNVFVELLQPGIVWMHVLGRFAVWMTLIKLYERKTPRDYAQLLALSLLLILAGAVQSTELLFGVVVIVYAVLGLYVLLLFQLYSAHELAKQERVAESPRGYRLVPPVKPITGRPVVGHFRLLALGVGACGLLISALVFLIFPRSMGDGLVTTLQTLNPQRRAGFTDSIDLQSGTRITDSRRSVLTLQLLDDSGEPIRSGESVLLRGGVLDRYEGGGRWRASPSELRLVETAPDRPTPLIAEEPARGGVTQVIDPVAAQSVLFTMSVPVAVSTDDAAVLEFDPRTQLLSRGRRPSRSGYRVRSVAVPEDRALEELQEGLEPEDGRLAKLRNPRVEELSRDILRTEGVEPYAPFPDDGPDRYQWNRRAAEAFKRFLQSGKYTYVTDLSDLVAAGSAVDPIEQFLFESQRGHCEFFASALASLCWNVRIPVRVVTGYVAYEYDEQSESYVVLESNAHAWDEVRTGPHRWSVLDPTPPATLERLHNVQSSFADRLSWLYQQFEGTWNGAVVTFDTGAQSRLAELFDVAWSARLTEAVQATRRWMDQVNRAFYFGPAGYIWMGVVAFALLLAVLVLIKLMRRSRKLHHTLHLEHLKGAEYQRMLRQLGFYLDMLAVLERAGLAKPVWSPPLRFAAALSSKQPEVANIVHQITDIFYRSRYGHEAMTREETKRASGLVDELAARLKVRR